MHGAIFSLNVPKTAAFFYSRMFLRGNFSLENENFTKLRTILYLLGQLFKKMSKKSFQNFSWTKKIFHRYVNINLKYFSSKEICICIFLHKFVFLVPLTSVQLHEKQNCCYQSNKSRDVLEKCMAELPILAPEFQFLASDTSKHFFKTQFFLSE